MIDKYTKFYEHRSASRERTGKNNLDKSYEENSNRKKPKIPLPPSL